MKASEWGLFCWEIPNVESLYLGFVTIANYHVKKYEKKIAKQEADSTKKAADSVMRLLQKEYDDSLKSYHNYTTELLARYGLKVDTLTNTVNKFDTSVQKEIPPTLTILGGLYFDSLATTKEKRISYVLSALNADVHILGYYYAILNVDKVDKFNRITFDDRPIPTPGSMNFTAIIPAGEAHNISWFVDRMQKLNLLRDTFLLAMEFGYKSKGNKVQTPLRKVYEVILSQKYTREVDSDEFLQKKLKKRVALCSATI